MLIGFGWYPRCCTLLRDESLNLPVNEKGMIEDKDVYRWKKITVNKRGCCRSKKVCNSSLLQHTFSSSEAL